MYIYVCSHEYAHVSVLSAQRGKHALHTCTHAHTHARTLYLNVFAALLHGDESSADLPSQPLLTVGHQLQTGVLGDQGRVVPADTHEGGGEGEGDASLKGTCCSVFIPLLTHFFASIGTCTTYEDDITL